jgi:hypothetical protein
MLRSMSNVEGYYGETALGYTDYPFLSRNVDSDRSGEIVEHASCHDMFIP